MLNSCASFMKWPSFMFRTKCKEKKTKCMRIFHMTCCQYYHPDKKFIELTKSLKAIDENHWINLFYIELGWYFLTKYESYQRTPRKLLLDKHFRNHVPSIQDVYSDWKSINSIDQFRFHYNVVVLNILHSR